MNLRQIRHLIAVTEHGAFHAAAAALGLSQPALTKSIAKFEEDLGVTLFDRSSGARATPTVFGRLLYERGQRILDDVAAAEKSVDLMRKGFTGVVRLGFSVAISPAIIAEISMALQAKLPDARVLIRTGLYHELIPRLRRDDFDYLIVGTAADGYGGDLRIRKLWRDPFGVFMSPDHALSRKKTYNIAWGGAYDWLSSERLVSADPKAAKFLGHSGLANRITKMDVYDRDVVVELLKGGAFLCAWPSLTFRREVECGELRMLPVPAVDGEGWYSETGLIQMAGARKSPAVQTAGRVIEAFSPA